MYSKKEDAIVKVDELTIAMFEGKAKRIIFCSCNNRKYRAFVLVVVPQQRYKYLKFRRSK